MKIALLSTNYDLGGAAVVTARLCDALRDLGEDARMIVARAGAYTGAPGQTPADVVGRLRWGPAFLAERLELLLRGVRRKDLFKVSTGRFGAGLASNPRVLDADAVMIGWASQGFLSLDAFEAILQTGKPVVYTLHDLWAATALCHLPGRCERFAQADPCAACPYIHSPQGRSLPREILRRKERILSHPSLRLVAVSNWQRKEAMRSPMLADKEIHVIPHPFPVDLYQPGPKTGPDGKRLIVMAAARLDDPVKDLPAAIDCLNTLAWEYPDQARDVEVAFVGALRDPSQLQRLRLPWRHHGLLTPDRLRDLYARASVVLSSSLYETMGATLMEGMAAGAIPVSYGDAGQTDIITDTVNGFLAPRHNPASLAFALSLALQSALSPSPTASEALTGSSPVATTGSSPSASEASPASIPEFLHQEVASRFAPSIIARLYLSLLQR